MPGNPADERTTTGGHLPRARQIEPEPLVLPHVKGEMDEDEAAKRLYEKLVQNAKSDADRVERLNHEPEHPLVPACRSWKQAIMVGSAAAAEQAAKDVVALMATYYGHRPIFKMRYDHLQLSNVLSAENLKWLDELMAVAQG